MSRLDSLSMEEKRRLLAQLSAEHSASDGQRDIWLFQQRYPDSPAYNCVTLVRSRQPLQLEQACAAWRQLARRHAPLSSCYRLVEGQLKQFYRAQAFGLEVIEAQQWSEQETLAALQRWAAEPISLEAGPVARVRLLTRPDSTIMMLVVHHVAFDFWSVPIVWDEWSRLYQGNAELPALRAGFHDFVRWQAEPPAQASSLRRGAAQRLPADFEEPAIPRWDSQDLTFWLDRKLSRRLRKLAQAEGVTLFVVLEAAWALLLRQSTGQTEISVYSALLGRGQAAFESLVGCFVRPALWHLSFQDEMSWREVLRATRECTEKLLEMPSGSALLQGLSEGGRIPLGASMFGLLRWQRLEPRLSGLLPGTGLETGASLAGAGCELELLHLAPPASHFPLSLLCRELEDAFHCSLQYHTHRFRLSTIEGLAAGYARLLDQLCQDPSLRVGDLVGPVASKTSSPVVREAYPQQTLGQLFEAQVARTPEAVALVGSHGQVSFAELNRRANRLAHGLIARGVGPGQVVGLAMERSLQSVLAMLAILKSGAAWLPLGTALPPARRQQLAADAGVCRVLSEGLEELEHPCQDNPGLSLSPDAPAWLLYTSGARPKAVIGTHRGAVNRIFWMAQAYPFETGTVGCHKTPLSFVDSIWELFGPLLNGYPVAVAPSDVNALAAFVAAHRVTHLVLVPGHLQALLGQAYLLSSLRLVISSGEKLPAELIPNFRAALPQARLLNIYGSTEVSADVTCFDTSEWSADERLVPIGRPIANVGIQLLDENLTAVAAGEVGEICVSGDALSLGYHNQPELTAARFTQGFYRSGDLGRWDERGRLLYLGRADRQIKVRGQRVEPAEIEYQLKQCQRVQDAVVVLAGGRLTAYLEVAEPLEMARLRAFLKQRLPADWVPVDYLTLAQLPRTSHGKIDLQALPTPSQPVAVTGHDPLTVQLIQIWQKTLGTTVAVDDNFFELGGDSLQAVHLLDRIEAELGQRLPLSTFWRAASVAEQADLLQAQASHSGPLLVPIQPAGSRPPLFLVHAAGGEVLMYYTLSRLLGLDQPLFGLQAPDEPPESLEELAALYVREVRKVWSGPFRLGGLSLGGMIAFEMARQLSQQGQTVSKVILIDSYGQIRQGSLEPGLPRRVMFHLNALRELPGPRRLPYALRKLRGLTQRQAPPPRSPRTAQLYRLICDYRPQAYGGELVLFRCSFLPAAFQDDETLGWGELAQAGLEIRRLSGFHGSMLVEEPVVYALAAQLQELLG